MNLSREAIIKLRPPHQAASSPEWEPPTISFLSRTWFITHSTLTSHPAWPNNQIELEFGPASSSELPGTPSAPAEAPTALDGADVKREDGDHHHHHHHHHGKILDFFSRKLGFASPSSSSSSSALSQAQAPTKPTSSTSTSTSATPTPTPTKATKATPLDLNTNTNTVSEFLIQSPYPLHAANQKDITINTNTDTNTNTPKKYKYKYKVLAHGKEGQLSPWMHDDGDGWISDSSGERRGDWRDSFVVVSVSESNSSGSGSSPSSVGGLESGVGDGESDDDEGAVGVVVVDEKTYAEDEKEKVRGGGNVQVGIEVWSAFGDRRLLTAETIRKIRDALRGVGVEGGLVRVVG